MTEQEEVVAEPLTDAHDDGEWTLEIKSKRGLLEIPFAEIWRYRDLIAVFAQRELAPLYKQTILGPLWFVVQPLLTTATYALVFGAIGRLAPGDVPVLLFYLPGIILWNYFSSTLIKVSNTFSAYAGIFGKVYFPRLLVPIASSLSSLVNFGIQFGLLLLCIIYYALRGTPVHWNSSLLLLPLVVLLTMGIALGLGIVIASLTIRYRDLTLLVGFGVQLMMFATPVVLPMSKVPGNYQWVMRVNPMTSLIEHFRFILVGSGEWNPVELWYSSVFSLVSVLLGIVMFNQAERKAVDVI